MPTGKKSECKCPCHIQGINCTGKDPMMGPVKCHCHYNKDYRCEICPSDKGGVKLSEAKKFLEDWQDNLKQLINLQTGASNSTYDKEWWTFIQSIRQAQDLISYERGREEQRKIDAEIAKEICSDSDCCGPEIYQKIINPSPDAK